MQQASSFAGVQHILIVYGSLSVVGAVALAWLSWHGVEKWVMRLKDTAPHRHNKAPSGNILA